MQGKGGREMGIEGGGRERDREGEGKGGRGRVRGRGNLPHEAEGDKRPCIHFSALSASLCYSQSSRKMSVLQSIDKILNVRSKTDE